MTRLTRRCALEACTKSEDRDTWSDRVAASDRSSMRVEFVGPNHARPRQIRTPRRSSPARRFGITLAEVAGVLDGLPDNRMPSKNDWIRISSRWHTQLEARRREIEHLEAELTGCIGCGFLSLATCRVVNANDTRSQHSPGPRRLITPTD
jgi:redox-sensitive transcriptional activator SoxR